MNFNIGSDGNKARWALYGDTWPEGCRECKKCLAIKPNHEFHKHKQCKGGYNSICKACRIPQSKEQYAKQSIASRLWYGAKERAKVKGRDFSIELSDIIIPKICPILGVELTKKGDYAPSIDRIDSCFGYVKGNIQVISKRANILKNNMTLLEAEKICLFLRNKESEI